jgi:hypothetical protein
LYTGIIPTFVFVEPGILLRSAVKTNSDREHLARIEHDAGVKVSYAAHYEDFQMQKTEQLRALIAAVGARAIGRNDSSNGGLVKITNESLSSLLLNFDEIKAAFAPYPCLLKQLVSDHAERFAPCDLQADLRYGKTRNSPTRMLDCTSGEASDVCRLAWKRGLEIFGTARVDVCAIR